jgi:hypothetical protein
MSESGAVCEAVWAYRFGEAADNGMRPPRYPTDMTAAERAVVRPMLPVRPGCKGEAGTRRPHFFAPRLTPRRQLTRAVNGAGAGADRRQRPPPKGTLPACPGVGRAPGCEPAEPRKARAAR